MDIHLTALLMGIVEGLTEFIPVSSTGHLILAGAVLKMPERMQETFDVFIQLGGILAVVAAYPRRFAGLLDFRRREGMAGLRGLMLLAVTTLPAIVAGLALSGPIKERLFNPLTVAIGLAAGAAWILLAERRERPVRVEGVDAMTWREALAVGCFQCLALWPGVSRSVSTILGGMAVGVGRKAATEYSFFAAVPVLSLAALYSIYEGWSTLSRADLPVFAIGLVTSFVFGWLSVRFLIAFLARHKLNVFGWYRLALAAIVLLLTMA